MGQPRGKVYLIGAGPGDPGLLTVKGRQVLERADVVIYDYLASDALLEHCRSDAERLYVGKQGGAHSLSQEQISALLVEKAAAGAVVARLKGGDPFVFGRGGEEAEVLQAAGIPFDVIPGVTSAIAAPAYAGIPVTHRRLASSVAIVTGHEDPTKEGSALRWEHLAVGTDTLVFLMGVRNLEAIVRNLVSNGRNADTPSAVIRWGTTSQQRCVTAPLGSIAQEAQAAGMAAPAILIVGDVVGLREKLKWFEEGPLWGRRIVVTRSREQASELSERLRDLGAEAVELPTISIVEPDDWSPMDRAIENLEAYHWLLLTSPNAVRFLLTRVRTQGGDVRDLKGLRIGAIGPGTAAAVEALGVRVDVMPGEYRAEALVETMEGEELRGKKVLLPRASEARDVLPLRLREMGAHVDVVTAYRTVLPQNSRSLAMRTFEDRVDAITFTSSSTVKNLVEMLPKEDLPRLLDGVCVACIGPITAQTARQMGIQPQIVAQTYTIPGLVEALVSHFRGMGGDRK